MRCPTPSQPLPQEGIYTADRMPDAVRNKPQAVRRELRDIGERGGGEEADPSPTLRMEWIVYGPQLWPSDCWGEGICVEAQAPVEETIPKALETGPTTPS